MHSSPGESDRFRSVRVFGVVDLSLHAAQRDELVKRVFPRLRRLCEERGVSWSEVDLRWGVTDEQKAEGVVLPICLAEIDRTRPYFVGLLGQRYGWVPDEIPAQLVDELRVVDRRHRAVGDRTRDYARRAQQPRRRRHASFTYVTQRG